MVIARRFSERRDKAKLEEGKQEGKQEERRAWVAWDERRKQAEAENSDFTEPSPAEKAASSPNP